MGMTAIVDARGPRERMPWDYSVIHEATGDCRNGSFKRRNVRLVQAREQSPPEAQDPGRAIRKVAPHRSVDGGGHDPWPRSFPQSCFARSAVQRQKQRCTWDYAWPGGKQRHCLETYALQGIGNARRSWADSRNLPGQPRATATKNVCADLDIDRQHELESIGTSAHSPVQGMGTSQKTKTSALTTVDGGQHGSGMRRVKLDLDGQLVHPRRAKNAPKEQLPYSTGAVTAPMDKGMRVPQVQKMHPSKISPCECNDW